MDEDMHGGRWTTEMQQQWINLPANSPMISTYSTTFHEFNDPLRAWSNQTFDPSSSQTSNWFAEAAPLKPIKEDHQQDSEKILESFSEVHSSLLKNTEGGRCPPFPMVNQSSNPLSCHGNRRRKLSPDSCSISLQRKHPEKPITSHHAPLKVRKEKLGNRIIMLQQLVSPFGKTDTASVLLDAVEYIKCLHEQLTVLCTPYVRMRYKIKEEMGGKEDLRSRGLCLVPISTIHNSGKDASINSWAPKTGTIDQ